MSEGNDKRWAVSRVLQRFGRGLKTSLATVGAVTTAAGIYYVYQDQIESYMTNTKSTYSSNSSKKKKKKQVLVIPFDRLKLVEQKDPRREFFAALKEEEEEEQPIEMTVREVVKAIHEAAADPDIVALYGKLGNMPPTGWGDLEEVRNALRVFRESHRRHAEPNIDYEVQVIPRVESKPLYCYAPSLMEPSNKEYFLASIFTHIHMQTQGDLSLYGPVSTQFFFKNFLQKYGIYLNVFKHGDYKNAPNTFTEDSMTRQHRENVTGILGNINDQVGQEITRSRSQALMTSWIKTNPNRDTLWKKVQEAGTLPAATAWAAGLVDYMPRRDPLQVLLRSNRKDEKEKSKAKWNQFETDFDRFTAEEAVSIEKYSKQIKKKEQSQKRKDRLNSFVQKNPGLERVLGKSDYKKPDRIAVVYANGGIVDSAKLVSTMTKINKQKDIKCVVLRVNSPGGSIVACETIRQELKDLPLVVSFGNVAASGGYYVSAEADRIFANPKTITGSIGIFAIRPDLTGLAKQWKVNVQHVAMTDLAGTYSPFLSMTRKMKQEIASYANRGYLQFKEIVSQGRGLTPAQVESLAQGRVWTGEQAKMNGLVDELGGLTRALAYAERTFCSQESRVEVVEYPEPMSLLRRWTESDGDDDDENNIMCSVKSLFDWMQPSPKAQSIPLSQRVDQIVEQLAQPSKGVQLFLTVDENAAIQCLLRGEDGDAFPSYFWE